VLAAYRRTGADPPFGDPTAYHGVAMEGYYWRVTDPGAGRVVVALLGVSLDGDGRPWGTVALAAHPGGLMAQAVAPRAWADPAGLAVTAHDGDRLLFAAGPDHVRVDLGPDARLDVALRGARRWPAGAAFGAVGPAHAVPALSQYWHPHLLGARAHGELRLGGTELVLRDAQAYGEKNWGGGHGFPPAWWWGSAQGFDRDDATVAFAGGRAGVGPLHVVATSLVVALGDDLHRLVRPLQPLSVRVDDAGWVLRGRTARHRLEVEAHGARGDEHVLPVPVPRERRTIPGARQHLAGTLRVRLERRGGLVWEGETRLAGLERGEGPGATGASGPGAGRAG